MSSHQSRSQGAQFKVRPLIGAIALALAAPAAFAAAPAAGALPGTFYISSNAASGASYVGSGASAAINYSVAGAAVMQWGATFSNATSVTPTVSTGGTAMNNVAGFNIGAGATLTITNGDAGTGLLISDVTGQASQIYGTLSASSVGPLFIANANGVVLDAGGLVSNTGGTNGVAFLGFAQDAANFAGSVAVNVGPGQTLVSKGDVTVNGTVSASAVLVAGAGNVNVAQAGATRWNIIAGENLTFNGSAATAAGAFAGGSAAVVNLAGGASSTASAFSGAVVNAAGNVNLSNYVSAFSSATSIAGTLTNNGVLSASAVTAGAIVNNGEINASNAATLTADTGDVVNNGIINASSTVTMSASATTGNVTNNGSILKASAVTLSAGASAGTAANNGTINYAASSSGAALSMTGFNVNLYGTVNANVSSAATALSATNALGAVNLSAANTGGVLNLGTTLFASSVSTLAGNAVRVVSGGLTDAVGVDVALGSGKVTSGSNTYGYNLSVFNGATVSGGTGGTVTINGSTGASGSNINLDGTVAGTTINVSGANNINGLGGFNITTSSGGALNATFSGNFNAPNGAAARSGAGNFLYNYVPVSVASNGTATLTLNPTNTTTSAQLVNVLVNGSPILASGLTNPVSVDGSVVAQSSAPNSHLVFQATGNLTLDSGFYWPGLMYVGTINAGQPGSLSTLGTITLNGNVSNVIATNVASEGGIWFMTNNPLNLAGTATQSVLTNTNSWINFPAATGFATAYGTQNATNKTFYGMVPNATVNTILNTNVLASNMFYGR